MPSSSIGKCDGCGSTSIDIDASRADAVCTNCGIVLESSIIVSDIQFEENAHGGASAIGTFVSSDSKGGSRGLGGGTFVGGSLGRESREITLRNARKKIEALSRQLSLRRDRMDMAFHFFKLSLSRGLTRGRKSSHVVAACVYITCRTEGTSHMLIDFSDILQIDVYELGRTYLRLSQALCINIPAMDPCLYVMRFAHKLEFGNKTHDVSMTALRIVSRMKKDWIHFGRRPSGLCGAALLIASRLHSFHRSVSDVITVVKVHESTLRKRLNEFGETATSQLTLDEFMSIDLDAMTEEMDPPSYKLARKKDKERLRSLELDLETELTDLEKEIEKQLEERKSKKGASYNKLIFDDFDRENADTEAFITETTLESISEFVSFSSKNSSQDPDSLLMPPPVSVHTPGLGLKDTIQEYIVKAPNPKRNERENEKKESEELDVTDIDEAEIDGYLMSENEIKYKTDLWMKMNAEYLIEKAKKDEKERLENELALKEGRDIKKRKKTSKKPKVNLGSNSTALEAIEKIVQEKKISTKINYDVLRTLNEEFDVKGRKETDSERKENETCFSETISSSSSSPPKKKNKSDKEFSSKRKFLSLKKEKKEEVEDKEEVNEDDEKKKKKEKDKLTEVAERDTRELVVETGPISTETPVTEDDWDEEENEEELSVAQLLSKHRGEIQEEFEEEYY